MFTAGVQVSYYREIVCGAGPRFF